MKKGKQAGEYDLNDRRDRGYVSRMPPAPCCGERFGSWQERDQHIRDNPACGRPEPREQPRRGKLPRV